MILDWILIAWLLKKAIAIYQSGIVPLISRAEYERLLREGQQMRIVK